jgi:hypothetical protein
MALKANNAMPGILSFLILAAVLFTLSITGNAPIASADIAEGYRTIPGEEILTDKAAYHLGELVTIHYMGRLHAETFLILRVGNDIYKYDEGMLKEMRFRPTRTGQHEMSLMHNDGSILHMHSFMVGQNPSKPIIRIPNNNYVGEPLKIDIDTEDKYIITIEDANGQYAYEGEGTQSLYYTPRVEGKHSIVVESIRIEGLVFIDRNEFEAMQRYQPFAEAGEQQTHGRQNAKPPLITYKDGTDSSIRLDIRRPSAMTAEVKKMERRGEIEADSVQGRKDILIEMSNSRIKSIVLRDVNTEKSNNIILEEMPLQYFSDMNGTYAYLLDPSGTEFERGTLSAIATGTELYKCTDYNEMIRQCNDEWEYIMDLNPGEEYELSFDMVDPVFVEVGASVINTNVSDYIIGERGKIIIAAADEEGYPARYSDVYMNITMPNGTILEYNNLGLGIEEVSIGLYEATTPILQEAGVYKASVYIEGYRIESYYETFFMVHQALPVRILRDAPTLHDPDWKKISVTLDLDHELLDKHVQSTGEKIDTGQLYTITDSVPLSFELIDIGNGIVRRDATSQYITWTRQYDGSPSPISYTVQSPHESPRRYKIGPATITLDNILFTESRPWSILIDPALNVSITPTAVESCLSNGGAATCTVAQVEASDDVYAAGGLSYRFNPPGIAQIVTQHFNNSALPPGANLTGAWLQVEWRTSTEAATQCEVEVYNNGTGAWVSLSTDCPGTTDNLMTYDLYAAGINTAQRAQNTRIRVTATATANPAKTLYVDLVNVTLTYIPDPPPRWSNPIRNATVVNHGDTVRFNVTWTDNLNLSGFIFSTNDTGTWVNSTFTPFTGPLNYSIQDYIITATPNTRIGWAFYANDSYNGWNVTSIQSFLVADPTDMIPPSITNEAITPISGASGTVFNISATITDNVAVQNGYAEIWYPNGTRINHTMSSSGSTYYYLYNSHMGGIYNATIYADDSNANVNRSGVILNFNVTSTATTDRAFYERSDTVMIEGRGFSPSSTQTIRLYHANGTTVSGLYGFPVTRNTNSMGQIAASITMPSQLDFSSGNYTIGIEDAVHTFLNHNTSIRVIHKPNTARVTDSGRTAENVLPSLLHSDGNNATITGTATEDYIELTFVNKIPSQGYVVEGAYFGIQHFQPASQTIYLRYYNTTSLAWVNVCAFTGSTASRFESCDLSSIITTDTLANDIRLRISDNNAIGSGTFENVDFVYMHIPTYPSNETIVKIITPSYIGKAYDYSSTTMNKAYGSSYSGALPPTAQLTGIEASSNDYSNIASSNNNRWQTTITTGNAPSSRAYQSFYFTITEGFEDISSIMLFHEGYATRRTDFLADPFYIYAYNYTSSSYALIASVGAASTDVITTYDWSDGFSDIIRSDGQMNIIVVGDHTTAGGPNARADIYTDHIYINVNAIPVISGSALINASALDYGEGIDYCEYRFINSSGAQLGPGSMPFQSAIYYNAYADTTLVSNGLYDINVTCYDNDIGSGWDTVMVRVVNSQVIINLSAPMNETIFGTNDISFTYNASSQASGVMYCNLTVNGIIEEANILTGNPGTKTVEKTGLSDGIKYWNVTCTDNAGQTNTSETWMFVINTQPPDIVLYNPINDSWLNYTDINFTYIPYDSVPIDSCSLYLNSVWNQTNIIITPNTMNMFSLMSMLQGHYSWIVGCHDSYGMASNSTSFNFTIDTTSPLVTINGPANGTTFDNVPTVQLNYTATDNLDNLPACEIIINGFVEDTNYALNDTMQSRDLALADGNKTWFVRCTDRAGNVGISDTWWFRVVGSPTVILIEPPNMTYLQGSFIEFTYYAEDGDGLLYCNLLIDNAFNQTNSTILNNPGNNTFSLTNVDEGQRIWNVECEDTTNAIGRAPNNYTFIVDNTPPSITVSYPTEGTELDTGFAEFNFTVTDGWSPNMTCSIYVNGAPSPGNQNFTALNNTLASRTHSGLTDGNHYYSIGCYDRAGNYASTGIINFSVDGPPTIILYNPMNNSYNNGSDVNFTYFLSDQGGVDSCSLILNGAVNQTTSSLNNPGNNSFIISSIPQGEHYWTVRCIDTASNIGEPEPHYFISDKTAPLVTALYPDGHAIPSNDILFNFTATDNYATQMSCAISVDSGDYVGYVNATNNTITQGTVMGVPNGFHTYNISCIDYVGNAGFSSTMNFTVDSRPIVIMDSPSPGYVDTDGDITFTYRVYDSTLTYCELYVNGEYNHTNSTHVMQGGSPNTFSLSGLGEEAYDWQVYCYNDNLFNGTDPFAPFDFYVSFSPPTAMLNYPENLSLIRSGTVNFNWTAIDSIVPMMYCDLIVNDTAVDYYIESPNGTYTTYSLSGFMPDLYTWTVNCTDGAYYYSPEINFFEIDGTPSVTLIAPPDYGTVGSSTIDFVYMPGSVYGFQFCELYFNSMPEQTDVLIDEGVNNKFSHTGASEGWHDWFVSCLDIISQEANSTVFNVLVDLTDPVTTAISPDDDLFSVSTVSFNWTSYDNFASVLSCDIYINGSLRQGGILMDNNTYHDTLLSGFTDGYHSWNAACYDDGGRNGTSSTLLFNVQEPPSIFLNSPFNGYRNNTINRTVFYTPIDNSLTVANCSLYINGAYDQYYDNITHGAQNNFSLTGLSHGAYNWTVGCYDPAGNFGINDTNYTFHVDLEGPYISINYPLNESVLNENDINFNWTATDHPGTIVSCDLYLDGALNVSGITGLSGTVFNQTITALEDGPHNWSLTCTDDLGNMNSTETYYFTINQPDLYLDDSRIFLNDTNPDWGTEIMIIANVSNIGGNPAWNANISFWDGDKDTGIFLGYGIVNLSVGESKLVNVTYNVTGFHSFYVEADPDNLIGELNESNNNGTLNFSVLRSIITSPANDTWTAMSPQEVNFTVSDYLGSMLSYNIFRNNAGIISATASDGVPQTEMVGMIEGANSIIVMATDALSRQKNSTPIIIYYDITPPSTVFIAPNGTFFNTTTPTIEYTITDNLAPTIDYAFFINTILESSGSITNNTQVNTTISPHSEGLHEAIVQSTDLAGNTINHSLSFFIDLTAPVITLLSPENNSNFTHTEINITFSASDNLDEQPMCNVYLNSGIVAENVSLTNDTIYLYTFTELSEGTHTWQVECWDGLGTQKNNVAYSEERTINVYIPPVVTLLSPLNNTYTSINNQIFSYNVSDDTGILSCSLYINGIINQTDSSVANNAENSFIINGLADGYYDWMVSCIDNTTFEVQGNSSLWLLTIDTVAPVSEILTLNGTWFNTPTPQISAIINDSLDPMLNYTLFVNGSQNTAGTMPNATVTGITLDSLSNDMHSIILQGTDDAGNSMNSSVTTIYVDTIAPQITLLSPPSGLEIFNTTVTFNFTATDNMAQLLYCNLQISNHGQIQINATNNVQYSHTEDNLAAGLHYWNVTCSDIAGNSNISETWNFTIPLPDMAITENDIYFNATNPSEGENITIFANISNLGITATGPFTVRFHEGLPDMTNQIGPDRILSLLALENGTVNVSWIAKIGSTDIWVVVDPDNEVTEENETNNNASRTITIESWQYVYGNVSGNLQIDDSDSETVFVWMPENITGSHLYITDLDSSIEWTSLEALSRDTIGTYRADDFNTLDIALGSENYTDSINSTYTEGGNPVAVEAFSIFGSQIENVPVINSTSMSPFITGVLWDTSVGPEYYDGTQDIVFITRIRQNTQGGLGIYDFEFRVPANLRMLKGPDNHAVAIYAEII